MTDIIHINQPGAVEDDGKKVRLGQMVLVPADPDAPDGPKKLVLKPGRVCIKLGNGIELSDQAPNVPGSVGLAVTAEAAARMGWPHPSNVPKPGPADLPRLQKIVASDNFGQMERLDALRQVREIDPERGRTLGAAYAWLEAP